MHNLRFLRERAEEAVQVAAGIVQSNEIREAARPSYMRHVDRYAPGTLARWRTGDFGLIKRQEIRPRTTETEAMQPGDKVRIVFGTTALLGIVTLKEIVPVTLFNGRGRLSAWLGGGTLEADAAAVACLEGMRRPEHLRDRFVPRHEDVFHGLILRW